MLCRDCKRMLPAWKANKNKIICLTCERKILRKHEADRKAIKQAENEFYADNGLIAWLRK